MNRDFKKLQRAQLNVQLMTEKKSIAVSNLKDLTSDLVHKYDMHTYKNHDDPNFPDRFAPVDTTGIILLLLLTRHSKRS